MKRQSAGILLYHMDPELRFFLVHPGGPFWAKRDEGAWSIPKGEFADGEDPLAAAKREFFEETGQTVDGDFRTLETVRQRSGKLVHAFAVEGNADAEKIVSNHFEMEWPPRSGKRQSFPEVDRAGWFSLEDALRKIIPAQAALLYEASRFAGR